MPMDVRRTEHDPLSLRRKQSVTGTFVARSLALPKKLNYDLRNPDLVGV